ncbi:hypothetical protein CGI09_27765, partial [Vibrio parahaemolyticus]
MLPSLHNDDAIRTIVINRLMENLIPGCQFLYAPLAKAITGLDQDVIDVLSRGFFKSGPITAIEAAKLARKF